MKKATLWILMLLLFRITSAQTTLNIKVKDSYDYSTAVSGATVTLAGVSVVTAGDGLATFIVPTTAVDTSYNFTIKAPGFINYDYGYVYVGANSSSDETSAYIDRAYSISFIVVDKNKKGIIGAEININDSLATTDATGHAGFIKKFPSKGNLYNFRISATGYADYNSSVSLNNADTLLDTIVLQLAYTLKLTITDSSSVPIQDASVSIANQTETSGSVGIVSFLKKINGSYSYQVSRSGYIDRAGTITVADKDTDVNLILTEGHDLKLIVINGSAGTVGMQNDTITIGSISKITDNNGIAMFGVDTGNISFTVHKAGFLDTPVSFHVTGMNDSILIYMTPFYNVYFSIMDEFLNLPLQGVHVNMNGLNGISDENGLVSFLNLPPLDSLYKYTMTSDSGYISVSGTISLGNSSTYADQFNAVNIYQAMNKPGITISLTGNMMWYNSPATINVNGVDYEYNTGLGLNRIDIAPGTYKYIITPGDQDAAILKGFLTVTNSGNDFQSFDITPGFKVEIFAADIHSNPIPGASVVFAGDTVLTDDSGDAIFLREPTGDYTYSINEQGYKAINAVKLGIATSDVIEIATMNLLGYKVVFHVTNALVGIDGAMVDFNSESFQTDANGSVTFDGLATGDFSYSVSKDGFVVQLGFVSISDTDVLKEVAMIVDGINKNTMSTINIFPNPATDKMNISLDEMSNQDVKVIIVDLTGKVLKTVNFQRAGSEIEVNINDLNEGIYLVKVQTDSNSHFLKLMKK